VSTSAFPVLHAAEFGSGPVPLLCVHGWACDGGQFAALGEALGRGFRLICPDLPGHGWTPLGDFQPGFDAYAAALARFAAERSLREAAIIGHSMGGVLSLIAAADHGLRPRWVANLDGALPPTAQVLAGQAALLQKSRAPGFREALAAMLRETFFLTHERDERCDRIVAAMTSAPEEVLRFLPEQIGTLNSEKILRRLATPVLYIGNALPRYDAAQAASLMKFREERIADAGHFLHVFAADRVAEIVRRLAPA
jgi:pimeloyl-ACP methyl ester carboxylesterase